jgi:DNA-binding response OmpR family regulator
MHARPKVFDPGADSTEEAFMRRPAHARHQPTVLLVEDDEATRNVMTRILVREGYLTLTAESSHDALSILRAPLEPIDVVILDVHLPDVSGIDLCARIRELNPTLPVVVCTGEADTEEAAQLLQMGVHRYFRKPIAIEELLATVEAALPE